MSRRAPERLLANQPHAVCDVVHKAPFSFNALGQDQALQHGTPPEAIRFEPAAISIALEVEEPRRQKRLPAFLLIRFSALHNGRANVSWDCLPRLALAPCGVGMPSAWRGQFALEK